MDILSESIKILKINSVTQTGNTELVSYLKRLISSIGLKTQVQNFSYCGAKQQNLIVRIDGQSSKEVLFNTHLDTVKPGNYKNWTKTNNDPFNPTIDNDKIFGLGSADVKLDYLCKLKAIIKYKNHRFKNPLTFVGTFGEELGLIGCRFFLESNYVRPNYVFVGEPTSLNIVFAHKSMITIKVELPITNSINSNSIKTLTFKGKSAHGGTPSLGQNAIIMAVKELKSLNHGLLSINGGDSFNLVPEWAKITISNSKSNTKDKVIELFDIFAKLGKKLYEDKNTDYDPPYSLFNIGVIRTENNKIITEITFRLLPNHEFMPIFNDIQNKLSAINAKTFIECNHPALSTDVNSFIVTKSMELLNGIGIHPCLTTKPALTEATLYQQYGAEAIVFGPGHSTNNIHKPNEHNLISHLNKAVLFYEKVINSFCLNDIP